MSGRSLFGASAVFAGFLGQVAFFADFGRAAVPLWLRIAAHIALILPLLVAGRPSSRRGGRALQAYVAVAGVLYLGLSIDSVLLVLGGVRMPDLAFFLGLETIGAVPAAIAAIAAARFLLGPKRPRPEPLFLPPWAGAYRTRPFVPSEPAAPAPVAPPPPRPSRGPVGYALLSTAFVVTGAFMSNDAHDAKDRFWGLFDILFFGVCAWVFCEQIAAGKGGVALAPRARRRVLVATLLAGLAATYLGVVSDGAPIFGRGLAIVTGTLMATAGAFGVRNLRGARPAP